MFGDVWIIQITHNPVPVIGCVQDLSVVFDGGVNRKICAVERIECHDISRVKGVVPTLGLCRKSDWPEAIANGPDRKRRADCHESPHIQCASVGAQHVICDHRAERMANDYAGRLVDFSGDQAIDRVLYASL